MDEVRGVGVRIGQEFGELIGGLVARQDEINRRLDHQELVLRELRVMLEHWIDLDDEIARRQRP